MLISAVLHLQCRASVSSLPDFSGRLVHGWFLEWVRAVDPAFSAALHARRQVKPFTVSGLQGDGQTVWLRITSLQRDLSIWLTKHLDADLPGLITIGGREYMVSTISVVPEQHRWAGQTTYRQLVDHCFNGPEVGGRVGLQFASPTTFRSGGVNVPLPLPNLVFGSLADRWAVHAPISLDEAIRAVTGGRVVVSSYHLRTHAVRMKNGLQIGFTGSCTFDVLAENPYWRRVCYLLANFAFYSGVGHKTTMGLGQVRPFRRNGRDTSGLIS